LLVAGSPGTAWLHCRVAGIAGNPHAFFLRQAREAMDDGSGSGRDGEGFVRLNSCYPLSQRVEARARTVTLPDTLPEVPNLREGVLREKTSRKADTDAIPNHFGTQ
jgi:hypothetical protein